MVQRTESELSWAPVTTQPFVGFTQPDCVGPAKRAVSKYRSVVKGDNTLESTRVAIGLDLCRVAMTDKKTATGASFAELLTDTHAMPAPRLNVAIVAPSM